MNEPIEVEPVVPSRRSRSSPRVVAAEPLGGLAVALRDRDHVAEERRRAALAVDLFVPRDLDGGGDRGAELRPLLGGARRALLEVVDALDLRVAGVGRLDVLIDLGELLGRQVTVLGRGLRRERLAGRDLGVTELRQATDLRRDLTFAIGPAASRPIAPR
jgi:hypothetical protein